jgi:hypothetical protein
MSAKGSSAENLRIVHQLRTPRAREYDLACGDGRLTVNVQALDAGEVGWRVEIRGKRVGGETLTMVESGATRVDALRAASREWQVAARPRGLDMFDWAIVEKLLGDVRAL